MESIQRQLAKLHIQYDWDNLFKEERDTPISVSAAPVTPMKKTQSKSSDPSNKSISKSNISFAKQRENLTRKHYKRFNEVAFKSQLPDDLEVTWSKRMTKTAGFTRMKTRHLSENPRTASIELSIKVIDDEDRLQQTLLHEMCHVAAFLIDGITKRKYMVMTLFSYFAIRVNIFNY